MENLRNLDEYPDNGSFFFQEKNHNSLNSLLTNGVPDTPLGQAVTNLHASWAQLICDLSARTGYLPPTLEHIKEVAECAVRQVYFIRINYAWCSSFGLLYGFAS